MKKKSLDPVWKEQFARGVSPPKTGRLTLTCDCMDWDEVTSSDFLGRVSIDLDALKDQKVLRKWHQLGPADGKKGDVSGHVMLHLQWRHDPALAFEPFSEDPETSREPNELRVGVFRARDLMIADKNLLSKGGSSDPRVRLSIPGSEAKAMSKTVKKCLEPAWKEGFTFPLPRGPESWEAPSLLVQVEDWDEISAARFSVVARARGPVVTRARRRTRWARSPCRSRLF